VIQKNELTKNERGLENNFSNQYKTINHLKAEIENKNKIQKKWKPLYKIEYS